MRRVLKAMLTMTISVSVLLNGVEDYASEFEQCNDEGTKGNRPQREGRRPNKGRHRRVIRLKGEVSGWIAKGTAMRRTIWPSFLGPK